MGSFQKVFWSLPIQQMFIYVPSEIISPGMVNHPKEPPLMEEFPCSKVFNKFQTPNLSFNFSA
jgi:hypothetical protein